MMFQERKKEGAIKYGHSENEDAMHGWEPVLLVYPHLATVRNEGRGRKRDKEKREEVGNLERRKTGHEKGVPKA